MSDSESKIRIRNPDFQNPRLLRKGPSLAQRQPSPRCPRATTDVLHHFQWSAMVVLTTRRLQLRPIQACTPDFGNRSMVLPHTRSDAHCGPRRCSCADVGAEPQSDRSDRGHALARWAWCRPGLGAGVGSGANEAGGLDRCGVYVAAPPRRLACDTEGALCSSTRLRRCAQHDRAAPSTSWATPQACPHDCMPFN